ncbi:Dihydroorotase and related enzymes [Klebsormidium nitens]|uniref:Dihydroorotase and related enzymes n=1 Tax=Klebsormidium nitens TaxID=105231 RepID=A0A1Y1IAN8_KLENI|nr:Dihydroorotase and related enzymes [Klebsormidium nitens]|eukprot:GAQ87633.1 Dihydroorotase and related enzymes [Klebsormidium nitens]
MCDSKNRQALIDFEYGMYNNRGFDLGNPFNDAQAFILLPRKGVLAPGSRADVIVLDSRAEHVISARTHHPRMDTNVYEGWNLQRRNIAANYRTKHSSLGLRSPKMWW